jgi:dTDP-4-amino-4,6-dideoxygalactose transaminase
LQEIILSLFKRKNKKQIEKKVKKITNSKYIILTNFGRTALYLILLSLKKNNKLKDEVLVSSYNYHEVINMIIYAGLKPVFYDLEKNTLNACNKDIKKQIGEKTLAILITHFNGFNQSTIKTKLMLKNKKIFLIEDCAIALNTKNFKTKVTKYGDFSFFSMNFTKNLSSITGGIIKSSKRNIQNLKRNISYSKFNLLDNCKNYITLLLVKTLLTKYLYFLIYYLTKYNSKPLRHIFKLNFKKKIYQKIPSYYLNELSNQNYNILDYNLKNLNKQNQIRIKNNKNYYKLLKNKKKILILIPYKNLDLITLEFQILFKNKIDKISFLNQIKKYRLDVREDYYFNCSNLDYLKKYKKYNMVNSQKTENNLVCLPNNPKINNLIIKNFAKCIN